MHIYIVPCTVCVRKYLVLMWCHYSCSSVWRTSAISY